NAVDLGFDLWNFRKCRRRQSCAGLLRARDIDARDGNDRHRAKHQGVHPARLRHLNLRRPNRDRFFLALKLRALTDQGISVRGVCQTARARRISLRRSALSSYAHSNLSLAVPTNSMHSVVLPSSSWALARLKMASMPALESISARLTDSGVG